MNVVHAQHGRRTVIVACIKKYSIDGLIGGYGVSRMGGLVKGREDTAPKLLEMCVPHRTYSFHFSPQASPTRHSS